MIGRTGKRVDQGVITLATILLVARQQHLANWFWQSHTLLHAGWLPLTLVAVAGFFGVVGPGEALTARREGDAHRATTCQLFDELGEVISYCQAEVQRSIGNAILEPAVRLGLCSSRQALPLQASDFGLHVWRVRRGGRRLVRLRTVRLARGLTTRSIKFTKSRGVVGVCWARNDDVCEDMLTRYEGIRSESQWDVLSDDERMGLTYEEHQQTKDRGAILAIPIRRKGAPERFAGCISLDLPFGVMLLRRPIVQRRCPRLGCVSK